MSTLNISTKISDSRLPNNTSPLASGQQRLARTAGQAADLQSLEAGGLIMWTVRVHSSADPSPSEILPHHSLIPADWSDITGGLIKEEGRSV